MNKACLICGTPALELPFGYDEEDELCIMLKLKMAEVIAQLVKCGVTDFICDCEYGIPMWGAEIVLAQKLFTPNISLEIYMPHEEQAIKWVPNWRDRYFSIHEKADEVVTYNSCAKCFDDMCDKADMLIYVGNDEAEVVRRFRKEKKPIQQIKY